MGSGNKGQKRNQEDISGQKFERLTALRAVGSKYSQAGAMLGTLWECQCECGNLRTVLRKHLGRVTKECEACVLKRRPHNLRGYKRQPTYTPIMASVLVKYRSYTRRHKYVWELTTAEVYKLFTGECFYCGHTPELSDPIIPTSRLNGIDRVDPAKGYVFDNCVSCCKYCNYAKNDMTTDEFFTLVKQIANKHNL